MHHGTDNLTIIIIDIELTETRRKDKERILFVAPARHFYFSFQWSINSFTPKVRTDMILFQWLFSRCLFSNHLPCSGRIYSYFAPKFVRRKSNICSPAKEKWLPKNSVSKYWKHTSVVSITGFSFFHLQFFILFKKCVGCGISLTPPSACAGLYTLFQSQHFAWL